MTLFKLEDQTTRLEVLEKSKLTMYLVKEIDLTIRMPVGLYFMWCIRRVFTAEEAQARFVVVTLLNYHHPSVHPVLSNADVVIP